MKDWRTIGIDYWFDYADLYDHIVSVLPEGARMTEVGSWLGRSTCYLGGKVKESGKNIRVFSVDRCHGPYDQPYMDGEIKKHCGNIAGGLLGNLLACEVKDVVTMIVETSVKASEMFTDGSLDCVFIDAAHEYENVKADLEAWWPKVKSGGIFAGHDYDGHGWPGVKKAVDEFAARTPNYVPFPLSKNCWSGIKT